MTDDRFLPGGWSETFIRCFHAVYSLFPLEHRNIWCVQVSRHWDTPVHAAVFILWVEMTNADDEFEAAGSLIGLMSVNMMWITSSSLQSAASQPDWTSVGDLSVTTAIIKLWTSRSSPELLPSEGQNWNLMDGPNAVVLYCYDAKWNQVTDWPPSSDYEE